MAPQGSQGSSMDSAVFLIFQTPYVKTGWSNLNMVQEAYPVHLPLPNSLPTYLNHAPGDVIRIPKSVKSLCLYFSF